MIRRREHAHRFHIMEIAKMYRSASWDVKIIIVISSIINALVNNLPKLNVLQIIVTCVKITIFAIGKMISVIQTSVMV